MENEHFWQFSDQLRLQTTSFDNLSISDSIWTPKRPEERRNLHNWSIGGRLPTKDRGSDFNSFTRGWKSCTGVSHKSVNGFHEKELIKPSNKKNNNNNSVVSLSPKESTEGNTKKSNSNGAKNSPNSDKRFRTLPASESLPRNEVIGGYIFVCNNDTMEENLRRQLFGLPSRYRDSVRAITPGLPLFLYNYTTHQLHGIYEAASFGGTNIDPTAWEDKKCPGESRFPAQVPVMTRKICEPLEEDSFRPVLHHYDGPKFRLELSVPEALALLDIFAEENTN